MNTDAWARLSDSILFCVLVCGDLGVQHCVYNLLKEHSSFELSENDLIKTIPVSKVLRPQPMYEDICNSALFGPNGSTLLLGGNGI